MKAIFLNIAVAAMIMFTRCKKDKTEPATSATPTSNASSYFGILRTTQAFSIYNNTVTPTGEYPIAFFSSSSMISSGAIAGTVVDGGNVSLNGIGLKKDNGSFIFYSDTTGTYFSAPFQWSVTGSGNVPAINHTITPTYPTYTGYSVLQSTIALNQNTSILLQNFSGVDEITVTIFGTGTPASKTVPGTATSATFTSAELSSVGTTTAGGLYVTFYKNELKEFGNRNYNFQAARMYYKTITLN